MSRIVVQTFLTLDGVMQAPGGKEEDMEDGFPYGGWQFDERFGNDGDDLIAEWESRDEALLLGRKTYQLFAASWGVWSEDDENVGEFTRLFNRIPKYVASRTLTDADLPWRDSHLLGDDVPGAVARLRDEGGDGEIRIWGSGVLVRSLAEHDLIDEYRLMVYPLVLGTGKKLFADGFPLTHFGLVESQALSKGVLVNIYRREQD